MGVKINFRQIEAFRAVMLSGGMTNAAEALYVTQPAISRLISDLEHSLGLKLFDRKGNHITPTLLAVEFMREVDRSFLGLNHLDAHARDLKSGRSGTLRIAALPAIATNFLPRFLSDFCHERRDIKVQLDGLPSYLVVERVCSGLYDVGICTAPWERSALGSLSIKASAVVVMPPAHKLSQKQEIRAQDLEGEDIIMLGAESRLQRRVELELSTINFNSNISTSLTSMACTFVSAGAGITITDPFSASELLGRGTISKPFIPSIDVGYRIIFPKDRSLSNLAITFRTQLETHLNEYALRFNDLNWH